MKTLKRIGAIVLALVMVLGMGSMVFAEPAELGTNETGVAGKWADKDTRIIQNKSVNIKKEIVAFNPNATTVHAPVVTYTYTVTPASVTGLTVTDETGDHVSEVPVTAPVKAGLTTGLVVTGADAAGNEVDGTAGTATSAAGTLVFDNTSIWTTAAGGDTNEFDIKLDFSDVNFTQPGVYRYQIAETISAASYDVVAMKDGAYDTVFLDVYVDGNLDIYGYVCMTSNDSVTPDTKTKINGFVNGTAADGSDKYYTYDLVLSKDVKNDTYAENNHAFPFTVIFSNSENYTSTFTITETAESGSTGISPAAASAPTWNGVAKVKDGAAITYTGIPAGVDVAVYETNDVDGVTYSVVTKLNGTAGNPENYVTWGNAPENAVEQPKPKTAAFESTAVTVDTTKIATVSAEQTVEIINTLVTISPTGVAMRFAPYALILVAGLVLLGVALKRRTKKDDDEK